MVALLAESRQSHIQFSRVGINDLEHKVVIHLEVVSGITSGFDELECQDLEARHLEHLARNLVSHIGPLGLERDITFSSVPWILEGISWHLFEEG